MEKHRVIAHFPKNTLLSISNNMIKTFYYPNAENSVDPVIEVFTFSYMFQSHKFVYTNVCIN